MQPVSWLLHLAASIAFLLVSLPIAARAQSGSRFDTGFTALQVLFTGTAAKVASRIGMVIGGQGIAHGEPDPKKALAGVAAGTVIPVLTANALTWLSGVQCFTAHLRATLHHSEHKGTHE
jgi:hypothetical protein